MRIQARKASFFKVHSLSVKLYQNSPPPTPPHTDSAHIVHNWTYDYWALKGLIAVSVLYQRLLYIYSSFLWSKLEFCFSSFASILLYVYVWLCACMCVWLCACMCVWLCACMCVYHGVWFWSWQCPAQVTQSCSPRLSAALFFFFFSLLKRWGWRSSLFCVWLQSQA